MKLKTNFTIVSRLLIVCFITIFNKNHIQAQFEKLQSVTNLPVFKGHIAWGDYNNDGFLDILYNGNWSVKVLKNNGNGTFSIESGFPSLSGYGGGDIAWGDYNNDGYLDILTTGCKVGFTGYTTKIYRNNGNGTFSDQTGIDLFGLSGQAAWGDYNNDGHLDILLTGTDRISARSIIYKNNGDNTFNEQPGISLDVYNAKSAWGDYDNDGDLDILLTGSASDYSDSSASKIYRNNGDETFSEQVSIGETGGPAWGDYNNDNYLDMLLGGYVYKNNQDGTFTKLTNLRSYWGARAWGDYDNDGNLDILGLADIWNNNGNGTFTRLAGTSLPKLMGGSIAWGDYNNDGSLDIVLTGDYSVAPDPPRPTYITQMSEIYQNIGTYPRNNVPTAPSNLQQIIYLNNVVIKWDAAIDMQSSKNGLSYNIRVGTTPNGIDIVSPMSAVSDGFRRIPAMGNAGLSTNGYPIKNLPVGIYYWSVQAIDNSFAGGPWAPEKIFLIYPTAVSDIIPDRRNLLYPNPATNRVEIVRDKAESCSVLIYDHYGRTVLSKRIFDEREQLDVSGLLPGIYLLKMQMKNEIVVSKLVIR